MIKYILPIEMCTLPTSFFVFDGETVQEKNISEFDISDTYVGFGQYMYWFTLPNKFNLYSVFRKTTLTLLGRDIGLPVYTVEDKLKAIQSIYLTYLKEMAK